MFETALLATCLTGSVDPALVLAIIDRESKGNPHALNVNAWEREPLRALAPGEVAAAAADFIDAGYTVDLGLMQVNSANLERLGLTLERVLDPCTNLEAGERILTENVAAAAERGLHHDEGLRAALSLYNTGDLERGFANGYVDDVWSRYRRHEIEQARMIGSRVDLETPPGQNDGRRGVSSKISLRARPAASADAETAPEEAPAAGEGGE